MVPRVLILVLTVAWVMAVPMFQAEDEVLALLQAETTVSFGVPSPCSEDREGVEDNLRINRWRRRVDALKEEARKDKQRVVEAAMALPSRTQRELGETDTPADQPRKHTFSSKAVIEAVIAAKAVSTSQGRTAKQAARNAQADAKYQAARHQRVQDAEAEAQGAVWTLEKKEGRGLTEATTRARAQDKVRMAASKHQEEFANEEAKIKAEALAQDTARKATKQVEAEKMAEEPKTVEAPKDFKEPKKAGDPMKGGVAEKKVLEKAETSKKVRVPKKAGVTGKTEVFIKANVLEKTEAAETAEEPKTAGVAGKTEGSIKSHVLEKGEASEKAGDSKTDSKTAEAPKKAEVEQIKQADHAIVNGAFNHGVTHVTSDMEGLLHRINKRNAASLENANRMLEDVRTLKTELEAHVPTSLVQEWGKEIELLQVGEGDSYTASTREAEAAAARESRETNESALQQQDYQQTRYDAQAKEEQDQQVVSLSIEQQQATALAQRRAHEQEAMQAEVFRVQAAYKQNLARVQKAEKLKALQTLKFFAHQIREARGDQLGEARDVDSQRLGPKQTSKPASVTQAPEPAPPATQKPVAQKPAKSTDAATAIKIGERDKSVESNIRKEQKQATKESHKASAPDVYMKQEVEMKQDVEMKKSASKPGAAVRKEKEIEERDERAQEQAILEAGVQRALVDTASQVKNEKIEEKQDMQEMKAMFKHDAPTAVQSAVVKQKQKLGIHALQEKEREAAKNLKDEKMRFGVTTKDELDAANKLHKMSTSAGQEVATLKKTLELATRLQKVAKDVAHDFWVQTVRLGEGDKSLNSAEHAGLKLLQQAAQTEVTNVKQSLQAEEAIKTQMEEISKHLQRVSTVAGSKREHHAAILFATQASLADKHDTAPPGLEELIEMAPTENTKSGESRLEKERQALVEAQAELDRLRRAKPQLLKAEAIKLTDAQRLSVAAAKRKVKQTADTANKVIEEDIQSTTRVDEKLADDMKSIRKALVGLRKVEAELQVVVKAEQKSQATATANLKKVNQFLTYVSRS